MATREQKLEAIEAAFNQAGTLPERWLEAYEAIRRLEPPTEQASLDALLLTGIKPTQPEHVQRLDDAQDKLRALLADILKSQA